MLALTMGVLLLLACVNQGSTQPYQLNWEDRHVRALGQDAPEAPVPRDELPGYQALQPIPATRGLPDRSVRPDRESQEPVTVQIIAEQSYDHYEERYRKVSRVESLVYRGGYPDDVVHCNRAKYDTFDIYIDDLQLGDLYKVRVTWDDGSHRTIERTVGSSPDLKLWITEPLAFDAGFES